jgi:hypothetical protein
MSNPPAKNAITQNASGIPKYAPGFAFLREVLLGSCVIRTIPVPEALPQDIVSWPSCEFR